MPAYTISADVTQSQQSPKLKRGKIKIFASVSVYWIIGENPVASSLRCAMLRAGESIELNLPVGCSRLAVLAVNDAGFVTVTEMNGIRASCSA